MVFDYTLGQRDFFLNALYSYLKFGEGRNFIVAVAAHGVLDDCIAMQLPCFNATEHYLWVADRLPPDQLIHVKDTSAASSRHHDFGSVVHRQLAWMKVKTGYEVLKLGYHYMNSDNDVVWLNKIDRSLRNIFNHTQADLAMLPLHTRSSYFCPQCAIARFAPASLHFYNAWLSYLNRTNDCPEITVNQYSILHNELFLGISNENISRNRSSFADRCSTASDCQAIKEKGMAALAELPTLFSNGRSCYLEEWTDGPCSSRRLYHHSLCGFKRAWKLWSLQRLGIWFLIDSSGNSINDTAGHHQALLNCSTEGAWSMPLTAYGL